MYQSDTEIDCYGDIEIIFSKIRNLKIFSTVKLRGNTELRKFFLAKDKFRKKSFGCRAIHSMLNLMRAIKQLRVTR
jgi:hypothetical protein